jgi:hypothetical protein
MTKQVRLRFLTRETLGEDALKRRRSYLRSQVSLSVMLIERD